MADEKLSSSFVEDASRWTEVVVDYVKNTQVNCLDLRNVPWFSRESSKVDAQPILDALIDSNITEINLENTDVRGKVHYLSKILVKSKIKKLTVGATIDDILSLVAILKDTQITELDIFGLHNRLRNNQVDEFFAHLANSHLRSMTLYGPEIFPFQKISVVSERLPSTQISCLDLAHIFPQGCGDHWDYSDVGDPEVVYTLMSSLPHTALTDLNLGWNRLGDSGAEALGLFLGTSKLEKLDLSGNNISDSGVDFLVPALVSSNISHLNLSFNDINGDNSLGHSLQNTKIRDLNLSQNPLRNGRMFSGPNFLQGSNLAVLKLVKPSSLEPVPLPIAELRLSKLTCLDLSTNSLNEERISSLADVLSHTDITHINLSCNALSEASYSVLGDCLRTSIVKYIDLSGTVCSESIYGVASFLDKTKGSTLVGLGLRSLRRDIDFDVIGSALANTTLLELDLTFKEHESSLVEFAQQLKFTAITALYLHRNCIGDKNASVLAEYLKESQIVVLDLSYNQITSVGAKALAQVLKKTKIRLLDLGINEIEDDGLVALAQNAENSCITYLCVIGNPGRRELLVDRVLWSNRKKIEHFADLLKRTAIFTGDSKIFEFDRNFNDIDMDVFIGDCLQIYKMVSEGPFIVDAIEQDKCILDLAKPKCCKFKIYLHRDIQDFMYHIFIQNSQLIYETIFKQAAPVQVPTEESNNVSAFKKQILWLMLEYFPVKLVYFIGREIEADLEQHVSFLRKVEELGLSHIVELLLLNRPMYLIDKEENILHPYVYQLLPKYKQKICNLEIEPEGLENIIKYFQKHIDLEGATEIISLCGSISKSS